MLGLQLGTKMAESAGTPGAARMSMFGLGPTGMGTDAPVYPTFLNNQTGYQPRKPTGLLKDKKSPLPSLKPCDDIPAALYPEGVSTGVGGGNAGQAQSQDPLTSDYIPGTGLPMSVPQEERPPGRDLSRPALTYGRFAE